MTATRRTVWTFAVTSIALFMTSLDNLVVTTALPSIRNQLHASLEGLQWTVNAYTLTFAVLLLTGATLGERYGRRRLFVAGLGLFTVGSAAAALAPGIGTLIAARGTRRRGGHLDPADAHPAVGRRRQVSQAAAAVMPSTGQGCALAHKAARRARRRVAAARAVWRPVGVGPFE